jgi:arylsulfatase A-like enzyme
VKPGSRFSDVTLIQDITPTVLDLLGIRNKIKFDGRSLAGSLTGEELPVVTEFYITECTWMRKHGWRTPEWKLIRALEPDFHGKPEVELYNLIKDPGENVNVAEREPEVVELLTKRMNTHILKREKQTKRPNPIYTNLDWHGKGIGPFTSSEQAYESLYIGSISTAVALQAKKVPESAKK